MSGFEHILDNRLGMFVHYGIYSEMAGFYNEKKCEGLGEWIQHYFRIPIAEYEAFGRKYFRPSPDFAKNLVKHAKAAGLKYIVLTSKHHDGFCLFKSDYTDYSTYSFFGRDICRELADECRKEGLELGFYYSHTLDWYEKDAGGNYSSSARISVKHRNDWDFPDENFNFEKYLYEKCFPQVKELLTNYGKLNLIWFDFPHNITKEQSQELRDFVKSFQPDCQINSRIAHNCNDYESLGDNLLPTAPVGVNLECLITLNDTWGYKSFDHNWKTSEDVANIICRTLGSDSTLLVNVGPMGNGSLTSETIDILNRLGEWTKRNSEAIYDGVKGNPFPMTFGWGNAAYKGKSLYLYVTDKTQNEFNVVIGNNNKIKSVSVIGCIEKAEYSYNGRLLTVKRTDTDLMLPVYKIEFENTPIFEKNIVQCGKITQLGVVWAGKVRRGNENGKAEKLFFEKNTFIPDYGKHGVSIDQNCWTSFWSDNDEILCWDVWFDNAGEYEAVLVHPNISNSSTDRDLTCEFQVTVGETVNKVNMNEEKSRFVLSKTSKYNTRICRDAGKFTIENPGLHRILLSRGEGEHIPITNIDFIKL